ncbi:hypothetical protein PIN31115_02841 [Pandoraea iniqua]|uniref:Putative DNA-binding domain-containing protein n=1 Tax=Pandoraea iniqua TaxID=2508288 RepID=A0A5E4VW94_9BURK|nr:DNA-binding domain-containing protein [Pandoraea iniqua]VVE15290.1 hypothetical protein PIN31115_02841 [Pandoraea iniqua]
MPANNPPTDYAAGFSRGLLAPDAPPAPNIAAPLHKGVLRRYAVYRNNTTVSLIDTLEAIYPAVRRITGSSFFRAMARFYVRETPPTSPLLFEYAHTFPDFIAQYEFARSMPWLPDTARIERAWLDAYHAANAPALTADTLLSLFTANTLSVARFVGHPATRLVRSAYPAVAIFAMNRRPGEVIPVRSSDAEDALVTRPDNDVIVSRLPPGGAVFIQALLQGSTFGDAILAGQAASPSFDLEVNLNGLIASGAFCAIHSGN